VLRLALTTLLLVLVAVPANATVIVAFKTPERVVLGSDSKLFEREQLACKIRQTGSWWTLTGGVMVTEHPRLDVQALTAVALETARTLDEAKAALTEQVYVPLERVLTNPSAGPAMRRLFAAGDSIVSITVAGADANLLRLGILTVLVETIAPVTLAAVWLACPGEWCEPDGESVYYAASVEGPAVEGVRERPLAPWLKSGDAAAARRLIELQIAATPDRAAHPVDVLELTASGARWHSDENSLCAPTSRR
jgi:hypothetical protein